MHTIYNANKLLFLQHCSCGSAMPVSQQTVPFCAAIPNGLWCVTGKPIMVITVVVRSHSKNKCQLSK